MTKYNKSQAEGQVEENSWQKIHISIALTKSNNNL